MRLTVMVIGGGRVGSALARRLVEAGHHVVLVERDHERARQIEGDVPEARVIAGEGTDPRVLEAAGIRTANVVTAVTGQDAANLVVAALARLEFGVPRTVARIVDPRHAWLFGDGSGVDMAVDQADLLTQLIADELSLDQMATLVKLRRGDLELVEERVAPGSAAEGGSISELGLPAGCVVVAILRENEVLVSRGTHRLRADDEVLAVVHAGATDQLARMLSEPRR
jgi:trk system potassium uptake protein